MASHTPLWYSTLHAGALVGSIAAFLQRARAAAPDEGEPMEEDGEEEEEAASQHAPLPLPLLRGLAEELGSVKAAGGMALVAQDLLAQLLGALAPQVAAGRSVLVQEGDKVCGRDKITCSWHGSRQCDAQAACTSP